MEKERSSVKYPRLIKNAPCGDDLFEGESHKGIANCICEILRSNENCNVIGIDGGWGFGKSNLVTVVKGLLKSDSQDLEKYRFFIYDAWGDQDDLQRRSIL